MREQPHLAPLVNMNAFQTVIAFDRDGRERGRCTSEACTRLWRAPFETAYVVRAMFHAEHSGTRPR